jgi:hypothetical protein
MSCIECLLEACYNDYCTADDGNRRLLPRACTAAPKSHQKAITMRHTVVTVRSVPWI